MLGPNSLSNLMEDKFHIRKTSSSKRLPAIEPAKLYYFLVRTHANKSLHFNKTCRKGQKNPCLLPNQSAKISLTMNTLWLKIN